MVFVYHFKGGNERALVHIDFKKRSVKVATRTTMFKLVPIEMIMKVRKKKLTALEIAEWETVKVGSDKKLELYIIKEFKKMGYVLRKKENG